MPDLERLRARADDFDAFVAEIGDIKPDWEETKRSDGIMVRQIKSVEYGEQQYQTGDRFTLSLCSKFGIGTSIFYLFDPGEVFERIQMVHPRARIRIVTDGNKCLAATAPTKSYVEFDTLMAIINRPSRVGNVVSARYTDGVVTTVHMMREAPWEIGGELFKQAFTLESPIDGYGLPAIYLSLVRESNNTMLTADSKTFRSEVQLGRSADRPDIPLTRALDTFNNEEGFQALRQRLDSARETFASVHECDSLLKVMTRSVPRNKTEQSQNIYESFMEMTGDVSKKYGIATEDSLSPKKARLLPMDCSVLDLIFFSMAVTTNHRYFIRNQKPITQWVGQLIDNEYDLEGADDGPNSDDA